MAWVIAQLVRALGWLYKSRLGLWIASALVWLGINLSTINIVIQPAIDALQGYAAGSGSGTGEYWQMGIAWMGVMNFDRALSMIISAIATKHGLAAGRLFLFKKGVGA